MPFKERYLPPPEERMAWIQSFPSGEKWMRALRVKLSGSEWTMHNYAAGMWLFCQFKGKEPEQILNEYLEIAKADLEKCLKQLDEELDLFVDWLMKNPNLRMKKKSAALRHHAAVKSFFKYNTKTLRGLSTPTYYSYRIPPITMDDLRVVWGAADEAQRFYISFLKDCGMSREDAVKVNYGAIRRGFEQGEQFICFKAFREKEGVEYETFIGPNTVEALKVFLQIRRQRGEQITDESPLFVENIAPYERMTPNALSQMFKRLSDKTGIAISTHRLRKFFETYMATAKVHPVVIKYWAGHKVAKGKSDIEMRYIIPPEPDQRGLYMEGYKNLDIHKPAITKEEVLKELYKSLPDEMLAPIAQKYGVPIDIVRSILPFRGMRGLKEESVKYKVRKRTPVDKAPDCQQVISETEIEEYLKKGFKYVASLSNGKVIVER